MRGNNGRRCAICLLVMVIIGSLVHAATISGTLYQSDGTTPLTGHEQSVGVISGDPCDYYTMSWGPATAINTTNGTYMLMAIPAGTWYLRTTNEDSNYIEEWWAASGSTSDCHGAQSVEVTAESTLTDMDFQLDPSANISGTAFNEATSQPITGEEILIMLVSSTDPCGGEFIAGRLTNDWDGTYTMKSVPEGNWYLRTLTDRYYDEWWTSAGSVTDCHNAELISVPHLGRITGKNFQLQFKTANSYLLWTK